jgi:hypothetical protein
MTNQTITDDTGSPDIDEQMTRYGITRKSVDQFHFGEYRYSNFRDALAEARRTAERTETTKT